MIVRCWAAQYPNIKKLSLFDKGEKCSQNKITVKKRCAAELLEHVETPTDTPSGF